MNFTSAATKRRPPTMTGNPDNPDDLNVPGVNLPANAIQFSFSRSSGPGGQNVNKLNTRAELSADRIALADAMPTDAFNRLVRLAGSRMSSEQLRIVSEASRSQSANRRDCIDKLRDLLVRAMTRPKRRIRTKPTRGSIKRRLESKQKRSQTKNTRRKPTTEH